MVINELVYVKHYVTCYYIATLPENMPCNVSLHLEWVFIMEEKRGEWKPPSLLEGPQPVPLFLQRAAGSDALPAFVVFRCLVCGCQGLVGGAVWAGWPLLTRMPGES